MEKTQEPALVKTEIDLSKDQICLGKGQNQNGPNHALIVVPNHLNLTKDLFTQPISIYLPVRHPAALQPQQSPEYGHQRIWQAKRVKHQHHHHQHPRSTSQQPLRRQLALLTPTADLSYIEACILRPTRRTWPSSSTLVRWRLLHLPPHLQLPHRPHRPRRRWPSPLPHLGPDHKPHARRWRIDNNFDLP